MDEEFIEKCRQKLFEYRERREHPFKDDKILTAWNSLMIAALSIAGRILGEKEYIMHAKNALNFILGKLVRKDGRLLARYWDKESSILAYIDDYSFLIWALIELYETTYETEYLKSAIEFNNDLLRLFWDDRQSGLFMYGNDAEELITRPKEVYDGATPSGNSVAAMNFLRLARLTGDNKLEDIASRQLKAFSGTVINAPYAYSFYLSALLYSEAERKGIIITGNSGSSETKNMIDVLKKGMNPFMHALIFTEKHKDLNNIVPFIEEYKTVEGRTTAYICEGFSCQPPITDLPLFKKKILS